MKKKSIKKEKDFQVDYLKIMEGFNHTNKLINHTPQWSNPNDLFVKFSLYSESQSGIASTETCFIP